MAYGRGAQVRPDAVGRGGLLRAGPGERADRRAVRGDGITRMD